MNDVMYRASESLSNLAYMLSYESQDLSADDMRNISLMLADLADTFLAQSLVAEKFDRKVA